MKSKQERIIEAYEEYEKKTKLFWEEYVKERTKIDETYMKKIEQIKEEKE